MKLAAAAFALALSQAAAFQVVPRRGAIPSTQLFAEYEPMEGEGKINLKIDLDSPKVATMVRLQKSFRFRFLEKFLGCAAAHFVLFDKFSAG